MKNSPKNGKKAQESPSLIQENLSNSPPKSNNGSKCIEEEEKKVIEAAKSEILKQSFSYLSVLLVLLFTVSIVYYNYLMVEPYLLPMFFALLVAIPIGYIEDLLIDLFEYIETNWFVKKSGLYRYIVLLTAISLGLGFNYPDSITPLLLIYALSMIFFLAIVFQKWRRFILTSSLVLMITLIVVFPLFFLVKRCVVESMEVADIVQSFLKDQEILNLIQDYENSKVYKYLATTAESWGWDINVISPQALRMQAIELIGRIGQNINVFFTSIYAILANIGSFFFSFLIFLITLRTYLESRKSILQELKELSPFAESQHHEVESSILESIKSMAVCSILTGLLHFFTSLLTFWIVGFHLKYIGSTLSAFLSIFPIFSTWVIWLPCVIYLYILGRIPACFIIAGPQLFISYYVDVKIYESMPGNATYVGLSVFFGISAYGISGSIIGPLLAGILATTVGLFKENYKNFKKENEFYQFSTLGRIRTKSSSK